MTKTKRRRRGNRGDEEEEEGGKSTHYSRRTSEDSIPAELCVCAYNRPCLLPFSLAAFLLHNSVTLPAATVLSESAPSISLACLPACLSSSSYSCVCCELLLLPSLQLSLLCLCVCVSVFGLIGFLLLLAFLLACCGFL
jgi:hypothetical protein